MISLQMHHAVQAPGVVDSIATFCWIPSPYSEGLTLLIPIRHVAIHANSYGKEPEKGVLLPQAILTVYANDEEASS